MDRGDKTRSVWNVKAALPLGWRGPIRGAVMSQNRLFEEWVKEAIREKAEREGIRLPSEPSEADNSKAENVADVA
jgi:hypothetical protein